MSFSDSAKAFWGDAVIFVGLHPKTIIVVAVVVIVALVVLGVRF